MQDKPPDVSLIEMLISSSICDVFYSHFSFSVDKDFPPKYPKVRVIVVKKSLQRRAENLKRCNNGNKKIN